MGLADGKFDNETREMVLYMAKSFLLLKNKNRMEIFNLVRKHPMNLTQIAKKTGLAYKNVLAHIKKLEDLRLVKTEKQEKKQGREVIVKSCAIKTEVHPLFVTWVEEQIKKNRKEFTNYL